MQSYVSICRMKMDVEQVVLGCQRKDSEAQKCLYETFAPMMLGVCSRYTKSRDEAQDLLHDGFIKVFENIGRLQNPQALGKWIYQIMVRESLNYLQRRTTMRYYEVNKMDELAKDEGLNEEPWEEPGSKVEEIIAALQSLPDVYRVAFNLHEVEEWDYEAIAEYLHQPETTVRSHVARAKIMIRKKLNINIK